MATMKILGPEGHATMTYDPAVEEEVKPVRDRFNELVGGGFKAFVVDVPTRKGHEVDAFDPTAQEILLTRPIAGG